MFTAQGLWPSAVVLQDPASRYSVQGVPARVLLSASIQRKNLHGTDYLVVPAVLVRSQVLENNLGATYLPPDAFTATWADQWNGIPVLLHHPTSRGESITGRDPEVLERTGVGFVFHARIRKDEDGVEQLVAEVWLNVSRGDTLPELQEIMTRLERGEEVELSTGFPTALENKTGSANGEAYDMVLHPMGADHLAIFADAIGACSVRDGCGLGVNQDAPAEDTDVTTKDTESETTLALKLTHRLLGLLGKNGGAPPTTTQEPPHAPAPEKTMTGAWCRAILRHLRAVGVSVDTIAEALRVAPAAVHRVQTGETREPGKAFASALEQLQRQRLGTNQLGADNPSDDERRMQIAEALGERFGGADRFIWVEAVFSDEGQVVFGLVRDTLEGRSEGLFQASFSFTDEGGVSFGDPQEVAMRTIFEPVENVQQPEGEHTMKREAMIERLVADGTDTAVLHKLTDQQVTALHALLPNGGDDDGKGAEGTAAPQEPSKSDDAATAAAAAANQEPKDVAPGKLSEVLSLVKELKAQNEKQDKVLDELRETTRPAVEERERERAQLIDSLAANERVPWDKDALGGKSVEELRKIQAMARGGRYTGRGGPQAVGAANAAEEPMFLDPVADFATSDKDPQPQTT